MRCVAERKIDELGRVVIPREMRDRHRMQAGSVVRIFEDDDGIFLEPNTVLCRLCGAPLSDEGEYLLCDECLSDIRRDRPNVPKIVPLFRPLCEKAK